jgi:hypothetical protein
LINHDETENYKENIDDKLIRKFLLKDFENENMSQEDWLTKKGWRLKRDSKKIPLFVELKKSTPQYQDYYLL